MTRYKFCTEIFCDKNWAFFVENSVADPDPDPPAPHVFGLPDPDPDPLVRGMDPDPSIIMQK
jgi:hypothetical protein